MKITNLHQPDLFQATPPPPALTPAQRSETIALLQMLVTEAFQRDVAEPDMQREAADDQDRG